MANEKTGNREYKSDVFCMLMEYPEYALQTYNALNGSSYTDPSIVEFETLEKSVSLSVMNDAAFLVGSDLNFYEHESTVCPNMPIRSLIYFATVIRKLLKKHDIYGRKLIKIPVPRFIVFYNGKESCPENYTLKLSDAYETILPEKDLELTCHVININSGYNEDLKNKCPVLKDYMTFVSYVREYEKDEADVKDFVKAAMDRCIEEGILTDFFKERYDEVVKVVELDYTFDRRLELTRDESWNEGHESGWKDGHESGQNDIIIKMLQNGKSAQEIADFSGMPIEQICDVEQRIMQRP